MALPASGRMRQGADVNVELGNSATTQISLGQASVRSLYSVASGAIRLAADGYGKSNTVAFGCSTYGTAGTYTFVVPSGISKISVVCVGGGAMCSFYQCSDTNFVAGGGSGGALTYTNCIPVTSGESLTVVVGAGAVYQTLIYCYYCGCCSYYVSCPGGPSYISRGSSVLIRAQGGYIPNTYGSPWPPTPDGNVGSVSYLGGQSVVTNGGGTPGGGGAGGYAGNGGQGGGTYSPGNAGSGGGGGGGAGAATGGSPATVKQSASGGGVGLLGQGPSGAGGTYSPVSSSRTGGGGGSGGTAGNNAAPIVNFVTPAGIYGGGSGRFAAAGRGGVRIIYGGTGKSYPSNAT